MSVGIAGKLIKGTAWITAARALVNILAAVSTIVLARYLTPADFGLVAIGTTVLAIVAAVTELSLSQALVRHENPGPDHFSAVFTLNTLRGIAIGGVFAALAYPLADFYEEPRLPPIMFALAVSIVISGLINPRRIMLQRELVFWQEFVLSVSQKLTGVVAAIAVAVIYQSYWALVVGALVTQVTNVVVSYCAMPFRPRFTVRHSRELLSFSVWLTLGQAINMLNWRFDHLLVGKLLGKSSLGLYTVGSTLSSLPTREMTAPLTQTIFPGLAKVAGDPGRLRLAYQRSQALVTAVALPAGIGTAIVADPLVRLAMGERWVPAIFIIQALAAVFALQTLGSLVEPLAMVKNETRKLFIRSTQMFFVRVPIIVAGLYIDGLRGLIIARIITGLFAALVNMRLVRTFIDLRIRDQLAVNMRSLISIAVMAAGALGLQYFMGPQVGMVALIGEVALLMIVGGVLYCGTMIILWIAMDRPPGAEIEILNISRNLIRKLGLSRELAK